MLTMEIDGGSQLQFEWTPLLVEGEEADGETMLQYRSSPGGYEYEYEYSEESSINDNGGCDDNGSTEEDVSDKDCHSQPTKRKQRRAKLNDNGGCDDNESTEEDVSDKECLSQPAKRKQRRAKLYSLHCYVAHTVAASAASASIMVEGVAAGETGSSRSVFAVYATILACVVSGVVVILSNLLWGLVNAIESYPMRGERWETAFSRFWIDKISTPMSNDVWLRLANSSTDDLLFRALSVVLLSLISGCCLGMKHPLQSALLCGF